MKSVFIYAISIMAYTRKHRSRKHHDKKGGSFCPMSGGNPKKGQKSKTRKGKKDFTTKKTSKYFNRKGHRQSRSAKGIKRRPYRGGDPAGQKISAGQVYHGVVKRKEGSANITVEPRLEGDISSPTNYHHTQYTGVVKRKEGSANITIENHHPSHHWLMPSKTDNLPSEPSCLIDGEPCTRSELHGSS